MVRQAKAISKEPKQAVKYKILYIDDEPQALFLFEEFFRLSYEVLTATSGEEGLKTLKQNPDIAVIVTFLFADVVGSTAIAAQIDAEVWTEIMNHVFEILSQAICC